MSGIETAFCRSAPWRRFARGVVLPWALHGHDVRGDVLELGAGSGDMAAALVRRSPGIGLTLTDVDERMVSAAADRFPRSPRPTVVQADSTRLPFADSSFDVVLSFLMLHHVVDWPSAVAEAARVLRPGGTLIGYDLTASPAARLLHRVDRSPYRLVQPAELARTARHLGLDVAIRTGWAGHVMRFLAQKG